MRRREGKCKILRLNPHSSPAFVARAARCRAQWGFRPRGPAGAPSVVRCVRHGSGFEAPRRRRCSSIAEERQRRRRGHAAATLRADGGRGRSLRCSSSTMLGHRLPPRALISTHETHRRTALGDPAGPRRARSAYSTVRYGAPSALVSPRHQRVSDGLAFRLAFGHSALLSAGRAPRCEKTPLGAVHCWPQQEAGELCG